MIRCVDSTFALWAVQVVKDYSGAIPLLPNLLFQAIYVENMATFQSYARSLTKSAAPADVAIIFFIFFRSNGLAHLLDALWLQTWETFGLRGWTVARMTTREHLIARFLHQGETIGFPADISEGRFHGRRWLFKLITTISASPGLSLVTSLSNVVGFTFTLGAEVLLAFVALDSIVGHMTCCFNCEEFTLIIFLSLNDLSRKKLHDVITGALDKVCVDFDYLHSLILLDFDHIFRFIILI